MLWFVFCKDDIVLTATGNIPRGGECPICLEAWNTIHRLPPLHGKECCCVAIDHPLATMAAKNTCGETREKDNEGLMQIGLRASFSLLSADEYQMAGKAREIIFWDQTTRFCGVCGGPMEKNTDISKRCTCCGKEVWPALATAIIVRITRHVDNHDEVLMVRAHNFRGNHYGLVAGFVETGESLEECLHREVYEEVGIRVKNVRYFGSQPWPYPSGLMVGFTANYASGNITLQRSELADGGWYRADTLPPIPGKMSLARKLIDAWLEDEESQTMRR